MKKPILTLRILFIILFFVIATYIVFIETEKYEASAVVSLKDLSKKQEVSLGSLLMGQGSEIVKDSKILEFYMSSYEMYDHLNVKHNLDHYYSSEDIDTYQRLYPNAFLPAFRVNRENLLKAYNKDLFVNFDNLSQTLTLKFAHAEKNTSQQILKDIITFSDETINVFSRESATLSLKFINDQAEENRGFFIESIKNLISYQNKHQTFDPRLDVERKNTILGELEANLVIKEVEYSSKRKTGWNTNGYEMKTLRANIVEIQDSIKKLQQKLTGNQKDVSELNVNVFDFEVLKNEMEFAKEVYKETLINQEKLKIEVNQNAKHLIVISKPTLPDSYTYPDKIWDIFTLFLLLLFLNSILVTAITILKDHRD